METGPVADVQSIYKQWQAGKILDREERLALRVGAQKGSHSPNKSGDNTFADMLS